MLCKKGMQGALLMVAGWLICGVEFIPPRLGLLFWRELHSSVAPGATLRAPRGPVKCMGPSLRSG
jgi:hypothetical protein